MQAPMFVRTPTEEGQQVLAADLRRGEELGLRWHDLDLDAGRLSVRQSVVILAGKRGEKARPVIQEPKSKPAKRTIDLDPATVAALRAHKDRLAFSRKKATVWQDADLVYCTAAGGILNPNTVLRNFAALVASAGMPRIGVHDLWHAHATFLLLDGVPLRVVSERLGHAKTSIALDTHALALPGLQHLAVDSIGAALFG